MVLNTAVLLDRKLEVVSDDFENSFEFVLWQFVLVVAIMMSADFVTSKSEPVIVVVVKIVVGMQLKASVVMVLVVCSVLPVKIVLFLGNPEEFKHVESIDLTTMLMDLVTTSLGPVLVTVVELVVGEQSVAFA